jgi:hypothetical protein
VGGRADDPIPVKAGAEDDLIAAAPEMLDAELEPRSEVGRHPTGGSRDADSIARRQGGRIPDRHTGDQRASVRLVLWPWPGLEARSRANVAAASSASMAYGRKVQKR